jgi:low affinity Fe/Cu permease
MKCILDKCPNYFESDNRGNCDIMSYCNDDTECPIDNKISELIRELYELEELKHSVIIESKKLKEKQKENKKDERPWYEKGRDRDLKNIRYHRD